jgi:hypothetical protein
MKDRCFTLATFASMIIGCNVQSETKSQAQSPPAAISIQRDSRYPTRWWMPVSKEGAPDWEILPQEAGPGEVILSKRQPDLGLLSNFAATPFEFHGRRYASLEGFWQSLLYPEGPIDPRATFLGLKWEHTRDEVSQLTAFEAKRAGDLAEANMRQMGIDWVTFEGRSMEYRPTEAGEHYRLIVEATWAKVRQNPDVQAALLSTGDLVLKPDHHQEPNAPAAWHYFDILTEIRSKLQHDENGPNKISTPRDATCAWFTTSLD